MSRFTKRSHDALRRASFIAFGLMLILAVPASAAAPGFKTSAPPYVIPNAPGVSTTPILTVGDAVPEADAAMTGRPGWSGPGRRLSNGRHPRRAGRVSNTGNGGNGGGGGTFTVLMNHELGPTEGAVRDHGSTGAFVSRWVLRSRT